MLSWLFIWQASGEWQNFGGSALILMGITAGTAAGAIAVTPPKVEALASAYKQAKMALDASSITPQDPALVNAESFAKSNIVNNKHLKTDGLIKDLLSNYDEDVGLHRVQTVMFTLLFGFMFLFQAWGRASMPTFSAEILALLGISGAAYVGYKKVG